MDLTQDLNIFMNDFGADATVGSATVRGLFAAPYQQIAMFDGAVENSAPTFTLKSSDVADNSIDHGTTIIIDNAYYAVSGIQTDGTGLTILILTNSTAPAEP